ncbi:MarR family winged helix-turn-helix transcriptional regulator [Streptomyces sp. NPDC058794]|uniref:MarR family winged helix-turn-helix transcriptional regulator n=1 Tax=unclassified Streptomyces TaxID=2593676 RepID=UPI0036CF34DD
MTDTALTDRWLAMLRACAQINQVAERELSEHYGLCVSAYEIMDVMSQDPGWVRVGELSVRAARSQPQVSRLLAQMVDAGYAERKPSLTDRRGFEVRLTPAGEQVFAQAVGTMGDVLRAVVGESADVRRAMSVPTLESQ